MVIRSVRHIPHIVSNPPRSMQNDKTLDLLNKKVATHNRMLAEKSLKDKNKQPLAAIKSPTVIHQKKVLQGTGKKKQLSGAEKALKAAPKLPKSPQTPHKITPQAKGKKLSFHSLSATKVLKTQKPPGPNLLHKSVKSPTPTHTTLDHMPPHLHTQNKKLPDLQNRPGKEQGKTKFGKLKEKAILQAAMPKKPKPIHKSLLNYIKPPI